MSIEKLQVPDEDAPNWIATLREGGFSEREIDDIMVHLNERYASEKMGKFLREEVALQEQLFRRQHSRDLTDHERDVLHKVVLNRFRTIGLEGLEKGIRIVQGQQK